MLPVDAPAETRLDVDVGVALATGGRPKNPGRRTRHYPGGIVDGSKQYNSLPQSLAILCGQGKGAKGLSGYEKINKIKEKKTEDHLDSLLLVDAGRLVGTGSCLLQRRGAQPESG